MRFDPIRHRLMRDAERAPNPPEIHPIDIQREGLPTDRFRITLQLGFRRLFPLTRFTEIPLAPRRVLPDFELPVGAGAMGTLHGMSLPSTLSFCHSRASGAIGQDARTILASELGWHRDAGDVLLGGVIPHPMQKSSPSHVTDRFGQMTVFHEVANLHVFIGYQVARRDQRLRRFAGKVFTLPLQMQIGTS